MNKLYLSVFICVFGIYFTSAQKPVANFIVSRDSVCAGDSMSFIDLSTNNPTSWQWSFLGGYPASSSVQNPHRIFYSSGGNPAITLKVSNSSGVDSISKSITVNPSPPMPHIIQSHDTLFCITNPAYIWYQWYDSTSLISSGVLDTFIIVSHFDPYNVAVTNQYCCRIATGLPIIVISERLAGTVTASGISGTANPCGFTDGIKNLVSADNRILLFPNPATTQLNIHTPLLRANQRANVSIVNLPGQTVYQSAITNPQSAIEISFLSSGIYFVQVVSESSRWVGRFVKE